MIPAPVVRAKNTKNVALFEFGWMFRTFKVELSVIHYSRFDPYPSAPCLSRKDIDHVLSIC